MKDKTYKAKHQIKTADFEYIEIECEGTMESIVESHKALQGMWKAQEAGLPVKEFNSVLDQYRAGKGMSPDVHERMNKAQQWLIHEIDKSDMRMEANRLVSEKN